MKYLKIMREKKLLLARRFIQEKQEHPINPGNRKIIIFTAFSDTADYLYREVAPFVKQNFGLNNNSELGGKWALGVVVWQCAVAWLCALLVRIAGLALGMA